MNPTNKRVGLPADVQENIIHNIQKIFPNTVNKELIRAILIKEDWDLEKSLQFLHKTLSSFNKDNKNVGKSNKKNKATNQNNKAQNQPNVDKQVSKPQKQQKKVENVTANQKKPDLFKKGPAAKQKQKTEPNEQGDWVMISNPLPATQPMPTQPSSKSSDDKSHSNESRIIRKKRLIQNYSIIKHFGEPVSRISAYIKEGIKVMILLRGCSGSGKTTYANQLLQKVGAQYPGNHIFSTDTYFVHSDGTYSFNHELLQDAHEWNQKLVQLAALEGRSPIFVDNTNTRLWEMREYAMIAVKYGYALETLEPPTPWFFNEDILFRKTNHSTPRETIRKMLDRYEANLSGEDVIKNLQLVYSPQLTPPQGVIAGLDTPMSKNHKKMLGRPLNNSAEGVFRSNEVKSKINMVMSQKNSKSTTLKKEDLKEGSVMAKNFSHLTDNVTNKNVQSLSNIRQNSKPPTSNACGNTVMFPYLRPYDTQNLSLLNTEIAASSVGFGVGSRKYEYLPRTNIQKLQEQMSDFEHIFSPAGITEPNPSMDKIVKQEKEENSSSNLLSGNEVLSTFQDVASDFDDVDSEPENMTSSNSSVTSDESEQEVESGANSFCDKYESNLEYVLVSNDNAIAFQKYHSEINDITTLEAFRETSKGSALVTSKQFEDYLMGFIENETQMPLPAIPLQDSETAKCYAQFEQVFNSDLHSQTLSQTAESVACSSQSCFSTESSTAKEESEFKILQQLKNGSDNEKVNVSSSNFAYKSAPHVHASPRPEFTLDEAMSTSDNNAYEKTVDRSPIETLHMLFPKVSRENLVEIFGTAQVDIDWAVGLLLDSGQEMITSKSSGILSEKNPNAEDTSSNYTKEQYKEFRDPEVDTKIGEFNHSTNPLSEDMGQSFSEFLQGNQGISCSSSGQFSQFNKFSLWSNDKKNVAVESNKDFYSTHTFNQSNQSFGAIQKNKNVTGDWDYSKEIPRPMPVEVPKHQRDCLPKIYSKSSVTTNTNYADFETLRKVNSNQGYVCHDLSKIVTGNPGFLSVSTPYFPSSSILMLEKGTMTTDIETNQIEKLESGVERLALMFPRVSRDNLEELFEKCQKDIDWAAGLLLDSGQEMTELHTSLETLECSTSEKGDSNINQEPVEKDQDKNTSEKKQKRRKRGRNSKSDNDLHEELQKQFQSNFVLNDNHYTSERMKNHFQKKNPKKMSINENEEVTNVTEETEDDESNENLLDNSEEEIIFMLDSDFILQLQSRFGGLLRPNMLAEKTVVNLPLSLARQIHSYVMDSVQQHIQEENIFTDEDEEYARTLQEEENRARGAPSLLEIMDEEVALRKTQKESTNGRSMASALSKQLLLERFPKMDPTTLASILEDTNHSLHQASFVLSSAGHEQAEPDNQAESTPQGVEEKSALSRDEAIKQADAYGDVASQLYELRKDCLRKSQKAYRDGNHSVALYYSDMARWYMERIEKSNSMAAKAILTGYEGWTTLDLHFLQVSEALNVLDLFVDEVIRDLQASNDRRAVVYVITGRGIHSTGGRPRLKPAVQSRLIKRGLRFAEQNPGMLRVIIPQTALTSYKQQIETST